MKMVTVMAMLMMSVKWLKGSQKEVSITKVINFGVLERGVFGVMEKICQSEEGRGDCQRRKYVNSASELD